ncbi:MAG: response regulator [Elusimicrobia bacterium]|nr:response regulator [Elusimicrobiota bacterium]
MKRILIVDDSAFMRDLIKSIISKKGLFKEPVEIYEADSKKKAMEQYRTQYPDLILLDIVMREGEREGIKFLEEVRAVDCKTQVIMLTAVGQTACIKECETLGILGYLTKPIEEEELTKIMRGGGGGLA